MISPVRVGIRETNVKITHQRRSEFIELQIRNITARARSVAETELESVRRLIGVGTGKGIKRDTYGDPNLLHLFYGSNVTKPTLGIVVVGILAEALLVAVNEPGVDAQDDL